MHGRIDVSKQIAGVIRYHENKIKQGKAQLIDGNTVKDLGDMTYRDKVYHFQRRNRLNERAVQNTIHVAFAWSPDEHVDNERMRALARGYLSEMALHHQPYLVYRHDDRAHPHFHIVCSSVSRTGKLLSLYRRDYYRTHELIEQLDRRYVQQLERRVGQEEKLLEPAVARKERLNVPEPVVPRLSAALDEVVPVYKYTTLTELNAVLARYQLKASRGREGSSTYEGGGLRYHPLTADGKKNGRYVKASNLDSQPTLKNLERRFKENAKDREDEAQRVRTAVDWAFFVRSPDLDNLRRILKNDQIETVVRRDGQGKLTEICYIDERYKTVFEGSSLGEPYSAAGIERRCEQAIAERQEQALRQSQQQEQPLRQTLQPANRLRIW